MTHPPTHSRILIISLSDTLDQLSEWSAILGPGLEATVLRGGDRQKLELALQAARYDVIHVLGHGQTSALQATDGLISEAEFVTLLEEQTALEFVLLAICDSLEIGARLHNALHVPVVAYSAPISDQAAVEFSRAFYRVWRRERDVAAAVERARESLAVLFPGESRAVKLINGDMITPARFSATVDQISVRLGEMGAQMHDVHEGVAGLNTRVARVEDRLAHMQLPSNLMVGILALLALLLVAQVGVLLR